VNLDALVQAFGPAGAVLVVLAGMYFHFMKKNGNNHRENYDNCPHIPVMKEKITNLEESTKEQAGDIKEIFQSQTDIRKSISAVDSKVAKIGGALNVTFD
jgi:hypothetical protein